MKTLREVLLLTCVAIAVAAHASNQSPRPGWFGFGFSYHPPKSDGATNYGWLIVQRVAAGGPASAAGLQTRDMIITINGKSPRFKNDVEVLEFLAEFKPDRPVKFTFRRGTQTQTVKIIPLAMTDEQLVVFKRNFERAKQAAARP